MDVQELKGLVKFDARGLVPAIAQDGRTLEVLMLAYMNMEALEKTASTGRAHYFSRSRNGLWLKGETSGNFQNVTGIRYDCDVDAILLLVEPLGPSCHTGERTCFYRGLGGAKAKPSGAAGASGATGASVMTELFKVLKERKTADPEKSYVAGLYAKGLEKILAKIEEESGELVEAARVKERSDVLYELCDLWFHTMVLLVDKGIEVDEVFGELGRRFGLSGITEKESRGKK